MDRVQPPPAPLLVDGNLEWEVEKVLDHRDRKQGNRVLTDYLIAWKGYGPEHNSLRARDRISENCQETILEFWQGLSRRTAAGLKRSGEAREGRKRHKVAARGSYPVSRAFGLFLVYAQA